MLVPSTRLRRGVAALAAVTAAALAGCDISTDPNVEPQLTLFWQPPTNLAPVAEDVTKIGITAGTGFVQGLGGTIVAPCLTANRNGRFEIGDDEITIRVILTPGGSNCSAGPTSPLSYNVYLINLEPGTYNVRIIHEGDQLVPSGTVVKERSVTVS
jgi:hypothetical protein